MTDNDPVELHRTTNLVQAHTLVMALKEASIVARIDNEYLQGVVGEIAAGWSTLPRVLVTRSDLPAAKLVLAQFLQLSKEARKSTCPNCEATLDDPTRCSACGWIEIAPVIADAPVAVAKLSAMGVWTDLGIVLAVAVVPTFLRSLLAWMHPTPLPPYWLDGLIEIVRNGCVLFVMMKWLQVRGESFESIGVVRPASIDIGQTLLLLVLLQAGWFFLCGRASWVVYGWTNPEYVTPKTSVDFVIMVVLYLVIGFVEALAFRAYLISRLSKVMTPPLAVIFSALIFSATYFNGGIGSVTYQLMMGLILGFAFLRWRRVWPIALAQSLDYISIEVIGSLQK